MWVKEQRRHYALMKQGKPSHMTERRAAALDEVGFCWDTHEATWLERFRELKDFKKETGHCSVPANYAKNMKLATWVHHQRRQVRKLKNDEPTFITKERIEMLQSIGFVWKPHCVEAESDSDSDEATESKKGPEEKQSRKRQKTSAK